MIICTSRRKMVVSILTFVEKEWMKSVDAFIWTRYPTATPTIMDRKINTVSLLPFLDMPAQYNIKLLKSGTVIEKALPAQKKEVKSFQA
jgi:hypothetical protein